jgi:predicted RNase H-like HicB family nuclease
MLCYDEDIMIQQYLQAAMSQARFKRIDNPEPIFGEIPPCPGVWATGETEEDCRRTLEEALEDWVLLGIRLGHSLPEINGVRIEIPETSGVRG